VLRTLAVVAPEEGAGWEDAAVREDAAGWRETVGRL
jgi:hypothetical protein